MMKYSDCISITMAALNYILEHGWLLSSRANLNCIELKLKENGFVLEEKSRFDTDFSYGTNEVPVSPSYVISMLFDGGYTDETTTNNHYVTSIAEELSDSQVKNQISFIEVVKLIDTMRHNYEIGEINSSMIDINYLRFKQIMSKVKKMNI